MYMYMTLYINKTMKEDAQQHVINSMAMLISTAPSKFRIIVMRSVLQEVASTVLVQTSR